MNPVRIEGNPRFGIPIKNQKCNPTERPALSHFVHKRAEANLLGYGARRRHLPRGYHDDKLNVTTNPHVLLQRCRTMCPSSHNRSFKPSFHLESYPALPTSQCLVSTHNPRRSPARGIARHVVLPRGQREASNGDEGGTRDSRSKREHLGSMGTVRTEMERVVRIEYSIERKRHLFNRGIIPRINELYLSFVFSFLPCDAGSPASRLPCTWSPSYDQHLREEGTGVQRLLDYSASMGNREGVRYHKEYRPSYLHQRICQSYLSGLSDDRWVLCHWPGFGMILGMWNRTLGSMY